MEPWHRRTARDGRARDWGPRRHGTIRGHTARRRPNRCAAHREPFSCVDGFIPGLGKLRDTGLHRTARLADLVGSTWGPGPGKPSLVARANPRWLLSCGLALAASTTPHIAEFSEPLHSYPNCVEVRQQGNHPPPHPRQREPEGRSPARTRRQAPAKRRARQGGLRVGVGGRCN